MNERIQLQATLPPEAAGKRLDQALSEAFPDYSRSRIQQWIRAGEVRLDGAVCALPRQRLGGGERAEIAAELPQAGPVRAQAIPLEIIHEDAALLVINKPPGLVVHPAAGNPDRTLQNALLHHDPALAHLPRAGIVHRLDKDTSGLMVVARSLTAHHALVAQLQARSVTREYLALVQGALVAGGTVEANIGRHPVDRKRMAVRRTGGKPAVTHYRVERRFPAHTLLRVRLETGRTHQIRVHLAHIHHPIVGDPVYGGRMKLPGGTGEAVREAIRSFRRQALHAGRLALTHPDTGESCQWQAPVPEDMQRLIDTLAADAEVS